MLNAGMGTKGTSRHPTVSGGRVARFTRTPENRAPEFRDAAGERVSAARRSGAKAVRAAAERARATSRGASALLGTVENPLVS